MRFEIRAVAGGGRKDTWLDGAAMRLGPIVDFVSGEHFITMRSRRSNGGGTVAVRAVWTALLVFAFLLVLREVTHPDAIIPSWSWAQLVSGAREKVELFFAVFAGAYVSYYGRFASQWTYLANLYNQIRAADVQASALPPDQKASTVAELSHWKAEWIADSHNVHLAGKPLFASVVISWLQEDSLRKIIATDYTANDRKRYAEIWSIAAKTMGLLEPPPWSTFEKPRSTGADLTSFDPQAVAQALTRNARRASSRGRQS